MKLIPVMLLLGTGAVMATSSITGFGTETIVDDLAGRRVRITNQWGPVSVRTWDRDGVGSAGSTDELRIRESTRMVTIRAGREADQGITIYVPEGTVAIVETDHGDIAVHDYEQGALVLISDAGDIAVDGGPRNVLARSRLGHVAVDGESVDDNVYARGELSVSIDTREFERQMEEFGRAMESMAEDISQAVSEALSDIEVEVRVR